jgi:hypothetical protein
MQIYSFYILNLYLMYFNQLFTIKKGSAPLRPLNHKTKLININWK